MDVWIETLEPNRVARIRHVGHAGSPPASLKAPRAHRGDETRVGGFHQSQWESVPHDRLDIRLKPDIQNIEPDLATGRRSYKTMMRAKKKPSNGGAEKTVKTIRRATRRRLRHQNKVA